MTRIVAPFVIVLLLIVPACAEPVPTCQAAINATYQRCNGFDPYYDSDLETNGIASCQLDRLLADDTACSSQFDAFLRCLDSSKNCGEGVPSELCFRELDRFHACLMGQTDFEMNCGNGADDDGDLFTDCADTDCRNALACACVGCLSIPQSAERDVDLLFIIDNSGSMEDEQALLQAQFPALMQELRNMVGGLPNLHIGVTSTDLGTGLFQITYCEDAGGDRGNLLIPTACQANINGALYLVDVEPTGCNIEKEYDGNGRLAQCLSHDCAQLNCDNADSASTTLVNEANGCPRCTNYLNGTLEDTFSCIAGLGTQGCGFEQQLESMMEALDNNSNNVGFVRESAFLGIIFVTDEDDCSASNPQLFDTSQDDVGSTLGPITSYRCFEFGIACDINQRTHEGLRQDCVPRVDPAALLHPISRYASFLHALKDPQQLVVAAITGPVNNNSVMVGQDGLGRPEVQFSCSTQRGGAVPGIRMLALVEEFNDEDDLSFAFTSICAADYTPALSGIGRKIGQAFDVCLPSPAAGCSDPAQDFGQPGVTACTGADAVCRADCTVTDIFERGTPSESVQIVPACLEICPGGPCPGNTDPAAAYANGHPPRRDAGLPVSACWHINYQPTCPQSNFAELIIARQADPPPRTFAEASCLALPQIEQLCNDGVDNDGDCLHDCEDPDCAPATNCL